MRKIFWLVLVGLFLTSGLPFGSDAQAQTAAPDKAIRLTYTLFQPATAVLSIRNTEFAKDIEKRTNGRVKVTVYQAGSLLNGPATWEGVKTGVADMGNDISAFIPGILPFSLITELPVPAQSSWAASNAIYEFIEKFKPKEWNDVHMVTICSTAFELLAASMVKTPIIKLEDFKGKAMKSTQADCVVALGATIKDMPNSELYEALAKGVVDGHINHTEPLKAWKIAEVVKHVTVNSARLQPSTLWFNIMNKKKWESLPPDIQKIITDVGREWSPKLGAAWDDQALAGIEHAKNLKCKIYVTPPEEAARWEAAISTVIDARLNKIVAKGFPEQEVKDAWKYFLSRVEYWNAQQAKNNVPPLMDRVKKLVQ